MNVVQSILMRSILPVAVETIVEKTSLNFEEVYLELVRLEARGEARPVIAYFERPNSIPAAGWIALSSSTRTSNFNPEAGNA